MKRNEKMSTKNWTNQLKKVNKKKDFNTKKWKSQFEEK